MDGATWNYCGLDVYLSSGSPHCHHEEPSLSWSHCNTVVSNHVNSDHVPSFSCLDVWTNRQATSGVYAITVTTSAYHSRWSGRL
jgi:hypothetical protein